VAICGKNLFLSYPIREPLFRDTQSPLRVAAPQRRTSCRWSTRS